VGLAEDIQKIVSEGRRNPNTDTEAKFSNLEQAVQELQQIVVRLAGEIDRLKPSA